MFNHILKTIKAAFTKREKVKIQNAQSKQTSAEIPSSEVRNPFQKRFIYHGTNAHNPPGTKRIPPSLMPGIDPLDRKKHGPGIYSQTSRYQHKPWPFKKAS